MAKPITYIIREKKNQMILHHLPGQLDRKLSPKEVYADFDEKSMEMGWTEEEVLPQLFNIGSKGELQALRALENQVVPGEKIATEKITKKRQLSRALPPSSPEDPTTTDLKTLLKLGAITLTSQEKIINNQIITKTIEEQVAEGLIGLRADQKVEKGQIVLKSEAELVADGIITLQEPYEYLKGKQILTRSVAAAHKAGLIKTRVQAEEGLRRIRQDIENQIAGVYSTSEELKLTKGYLDWMAEDRPAADERKMAYEQMQQQIGAIKQTYEALKTALKKQLD